MSALKKLSARIPAPVRGAFCAGMSLLAGLAVALVLNYLLFRVGLPSKPFIYAAF
jgi:hypothetical protein